MNVHTTTTSQPTAITELVERKSKPWVFRNFLNSGQSGRRGGKRVSKDIEKHINLLFKEAGRPREDTYREQRALIFDEYVTTNPSNKFAVLYTLDNDLIIDILIKPSTGEPKLFERMTCRDRNGKKDWWCEEE